MCLLYWRTYIYIITETEGRVQASNAETIYFPKIEHYSLVVSLNYCIKRFYFFLCMLLCCFLVLATHLGRFTLNSWPSANIVLKQSHNDQFQKSVGEQKLTEGFARHLSSSIFPSQIFQSARVSVMRKQIVYLFFYLSRALCTCSRSLVVDASSEGKKSKCFVQRKHDEVFRPLFCELNL